MMLRAELLALACLACAAHALQLPRAVRPRAPSLARAARAPIMQGADEEFDFGVVGAVSEATEEAVEEEEKELTEKEKEIARLRAAEKFMRKETGNAICQTCSYIYKMDDKEMYWNTPFAELPPSWACPNCMSPKAFFDPETIEIAGFEDNQEYGFGTNTWTEDQKSGVIFGGLGVFFLLLMGGYALN